MNRIYQGRVTRVGILDGNKAEPPLLDEWPKKLWQHHELFQDAVNYYTLCLAAMSPDESGMVEQNRSKLGRFRAQVCQTWKNVTTETTPFEGPAMQVGKWLGLPADKRSFDECASKAFEGCEQSIRDLWKKMLADGSIGPEYANCDPWPKLLHAALEQALQRVQEMIGNKVALGTSELLPMLVNPKGDERRTALGSKARSDKEKNFAWLQHELYERPFPAAGQERQIRIRELRKNLSLGAFVLFKDEMLSPKKAQECLIEALDALDFAIQQKPSDSKRKHWFPLRIKDLESEDQLRARVKRWKEKVLKLTPDELVPSENAKESCQQYFAGSETEEQAQARVKRWKERTMKLTTDDLALKANKKHSRWQYFAGLIFKLFPLLGDEADEMDSELALRFLKDAVQAPGDSSKERRLRLRLHSNFEPMPPDFAAFAVDYDLDCIVSFGKKKYETEKLQERLRLAVAKLREANESGKLKVPAGCDFNSTLTKIEQKISAFCANFGVLVKAKDDVPDAWLCFRLDQNPITWEFLKLVLPVEDKYAEFPEYRIKLARGTRGYIFPAFTDLSCWQHPKQDENDSAPTAKQQPKKEKATFEDSTWGKWTDFDYAAFKEALNKAHQFYQQSGKKGTDLDSIEKNIKDLVGKGRPAEEVESALPGFYWCDRKKRDPRIATVRQLLREHLRVHLEGEDEGGYSYGLAERTLRGYEELCGKWKEKIVEMGKDNETALGAEVLKELEALRKAHQKKHKYDFGSAPLYKALLETDYHCVWREPTTAHRQEWKAAKLNYSANPLRDYCYFLNLLADRRRKQKPVSFTPAHAIESPQFFDFPKQSDSAPKSEYITERRGQRGPVKLIHNPTKRDEQNRIVREYPGLCFAATIAVFDEATEHWQPQPIQVRYDAPRLSRDELQAKHNGQSRLNQTQLPWLQPMMRALGLDSEKGGDLQADLQKFHNCAVTLEVRLKKDKKDGKLKEDVQLKFPLDVTAERIQAKVRSLRGTKYPESVKLTAREAAESRMVQVRDAAYGLWQDEQFRSMKKGQKKYLLTLAWPHEVRFPSLDETDDKIRDYVQRWYNAVDEFRVLSVDMGQRQAAAAALLHVKANGTILGKFQRKVGDSGNGKKWTASIADAWLLRLSGENRIEWRERTELDKDDHPRFYWREELYGERGRSASENESLDTVTLVKKFGCDLQEFFPFGAGCKDERELAKLVVQELSFPEQNDVLLRTAGRALRHTKRLQRWVWLLKTNDRKRQQNVFEDIAESEKEVLLPLHVPEQDRLTERIVELESRSEATALAQLLEDFLTGWQPQVIEHLEQLANRCVPLRDRQWEWSKESHQLVDSAPGDPKTMTRGQRGLSLKRIAQIELLRQRFQSLNKILRRTIGVAADRAKGKPLPEPCQKLLDKLDELKEQRVNQIAHMIIADALGLRLAAPTQENLLAHLRLPSTASDKELNDKARRHDLHGIYEKIPGRVPVDFIVIEWLSGYRTSQSQGRSENARLMQWCQGQVRIKLHQLADIFGIPVIEVPPANTSKFCARSGVVGFRGMEVNPKTENTGLWQMLIGETDAKEQPTEDARNYVKALEKVKEINKHEERDGKTKAFKTLLVPLKSGEYFIPLCDDADGLENRPVLEHADLNAAVSIGLRAISNPRVWAIHPRLKSVREKEEGETVNCQTDDKRKYQTAENEVEARTISTDCNVTLADAKWGDTTRPNFYADFSGSVTNARCRLKQNGSWTTTTWGQITIDGEKTPAPLVSAKALWSVVKEKQWLRVGKLNNDRLEKWGFGRPLPEQEGDLP